MCLVVPTHQRSSDSLITDRKWTDSYPGGELLCERLSEGRGHVVVLWAVVDLVSGPDEGDLWRRLQKHTNTHNIVKLEVIHPYVTASHTFRCIYIKFLSLNSTNFSNQATQRWLENNFLISMQFLEVVFGVWNKPNWLHQNKGSIIKIFKVDQLTLYFNIGCITNYNCQLLLSLLLLFYMITHSSLSLLFIIVLYLLFTVSDYSTYYSLQYLLFWLYLSYLKHYIPTNNIHSK